MYQGFTPSLIYTTMPQQSFKAAGICVASLIGVVDYAGISIFTGISDATLIPSFGYNYAANAAVGEGYIPSLFANKHFGDLGVAIGETVDQSVIGIGAQMSEGTSTGGASSSGAIFITNVTSAGNTIPTMTSAPNESSVASVLTDTTDMTVYVEWDRCASAYEGTPHIDTDSQSGIAITWTSQKGDTHYGNASISGTTTKIDAVYFENTYTVAVAMDVGPIILTAVIGDLPGVQTTVKAGDNVQITGTVEIAATHIRLVGGDAFDSLTWQTVSGGTFAITGRISSNSGVQSCTLEARNVSNTSGIQKVSSNTIQLDQTVPVISARVIGYPATQTAFKGVEAGTVTTTVTDYTSIVYSSPHGDFEIANTTTYENSKAITCTNPGDYNDTSSNFRIVASKASNNSSTTVNTIIEIADVAPLVTVSQPATRLRSSAAGTNHLITCTSNQNLAGAPGLAVGVAGTWVGGAFAGSGKNWTRSLTITDAHAKGTGAWTYSSVPTNNAGIAANIAGTQNNGGLISRDLTLAAFGNEVVLGANVVTYTKCMLSWRDPDTGNTIIKDVSTRAALNTAPPVVGQWCLTAITAGTIRVLDTEATGARSTDSTIRFEEII